MSETQTRAVLRSILVGQTQTYPDGPRGEPWTSAIAKLPIPGPANVNEMGLLDDQQADKRFHGGAEKALLAYATGHYSDWRTELDSPELAFGAFGENLAIDGITEREVCIGDEWQIGAVTLQVSQPRQPCWKVARYRKQPDLVKRIFKNGKSGWYFRVLNAGELSVGETVELVSRPNPEWTVARVSQLSHQRNGTRVEMAELMAMDLLSQEWKKDLM